MCKPFQEGSERVGIRNAGTAITGSPFMSTSYLVRSVERGWELFCHPRAVGICSNDGASDLLFIENASLRSAERAESVETGSG
jgi:hypothetical protein